MYRMGGEIPFSEEGEQPISIGKRKEDEKRQMFIQTTYAHTTGT